MQNIEPIVVDPHPVVKEQKDIKFSRGDFIAEKKGKFRDFYEYGRWIGEGELGEVRVWWDKSTRAVRAVKIFRKEALQGEDRYRFLYEIEIMKKLDHPNILRLCEIFYDEKRYYLVTELVTGGELYDEIQKRGKYEEKDAAIVLKQVLLAVSYCHANHIIHRDIKPENILIDGKNENIKLVEFNASKKIEPGTKLTDTYGTLFYMAPEVLMTDYDEKWDIWSVGVMMFILLSGYPPFDGDTDAEITKKIIIGDFKFNAPVWDNISDEAKDLIRKMLTYDPSQRISAVEALQHAWFKKFIEQVDATEAVTKALENLRNFKAEQKLQQAAITFIVEKLAHPDEYHELQIAFNSLDKNMDAKLSLAEVKEGYKEYMPHITEEEIDR